MHVAGMQPREIEILKKEKKKKSTPLGVFERPRIDRGVPVLLFKSNEKQKGAANEGQTLVSCTSFDLLF